MVRGSSASPGIFQKSGCPPHPLLDDGRGRLNFPDPKLYSHSLSPVPCTATTLLTLLKWLGPFTQMFSEKPLVDGLLKSFAKFRNGCDEKVCYIATIILPISTIRRLVSIKIWYYPWTRIKIRKGSKFMQKSEVNNLVFIYLNLKYISVNCTDRCLHFT